MNADREEFKKAANQILEQLDAQHERLEANLTPFEFACWRLGRHTLILKKMQAIDVPALLLNHEIALVARLTTEAESLSSDGA